MILKQVALACAAALALPLVAQAAAPTGPYDTAGAMRVYLSGASAPDAYLDTVLTSMFSGNWYKYTAGTDYRLYLGNLAATNQKVLFVKRSKGGSVFGVNPIGDPDLADRKLQTMILSATVCPTAAVANSTTGAACNTSGVNSAIVGQDPGFTVTGQEEIPDFGVSDVAPFMFKEPYNVEFGASQLASTGNMTIKPVNTLMMGIVTTASVPDTLQISNADYHAMLTANVFDWTTIGLSSADITSGNDKKTGVVVCRRWPGSGTQSSYNWYFNNFPCSVNSLTSGVSGNTEPFRMTNSPGYGVGSLGTGDGSSAANAIGIDVTSGYTVIENSGSGDVRKCLKAANDKTVYAFKSEDGKFLTVNFNASPVGDVTNAGYRAIGVLSLDSQTSVSDGSELSWFFRPMNGKGRFYRADQTCRIGGPAGALTDSGVCPNRTELRSGRYDFAAELTMQYLTSTSKDAFDAARRTFIDDFISKAGDPAVQALWTMALPGGAFTPDGVNNVAFASRAGNQCGPMVRGTY